MRKIKNIIKKAAANLRLYRVDFYGDTITVHHRTNSLDAANTYAGKVTELYGDGVANIMHLTLFGWRHVISIEQDGAVIAIEEA